MLDHIDPSPTDLARLHKSLDNLEQIMEASSWLREDRFQQIMAKLTELNRSIQASSRSGVDCAEVTDGIKPDQEEDPEQPEAVISSPTVGENFQSHDAGESEGVLDEEEEISFHDTDFDSSAGEEHGIVTESRAKCAELINLPSHSHHVVVASCTFARYDSKSDKLHPSEVIAELDLDLGKVEPTEVSILDPPNRLAGNEAILSHLVLNTPTSNLFNKSVVAPFHSSITSLTFKDGTYLRSKEFLYLIKHIPPDLMQLPRLIPEKLLIFTVALDLEQFLVLHHNLNQFMRCKGTDSFDSPNKPDMSLLRSQHTTSSETTVACKSEMEISIEVVNWHMKTELEGSKGNFAFNNTMTMPTLLFKKDDCEGHKGYLYMLKHDPSDDAQFNASLHTWELEGDVKPFNAQFLKPLGFKLKQELYLILEPQCIPKGTGVHVQVLLQWKEHPPDKATWEAFLLQTSPNLSSSFSFVFHNCFPQLNSSPFQPPQVVAGKHFECEAASDFESSADEGPKMETESKSSLSVSRSLVVSGLVKSTWRFAERSLSTGVTSKSVHNAQAEDRQLEYGYKEAQGEIHEQPKFMSNSTNVGRRKALKYKGRMGTFNPVLARELQFPTAFVLYKLHVSEKKKTEVSFVEEVRDEIATTQVLTNRMLHFKANDEVIFKSGSSSYSCENFDSDVDPYFEWSGEVAKLKVQVSVQENDSFVDRLFDEESIHIHEPKNSDGVLNMVLVNEAAVRLVEKMVMFQWKDHPPDDVPLDTYRAHGFPGFIREDTNFLSVNGNGRKH